MSDNKNTEVIMAKCPTCKTVTFHTKIGCITQCFKCNQLYTIDEE